MASSNDVELGAMRGSRGGQDSDECRQIDVTACVHESLNTSSDLDSCDAMTSSPAATLNPAVVVTAPSEGGTDSDANGSDTPVANGTETTGGVMTSFSDNHFEPGADARP